MVCLFMSLGISVSTVVPGHSARIARTVFAKCSAPPSGRSSRVDAGQHNMAQPQLFRRLAQHFPARPGQAGSGLPQVTLQKRQLRVQISPRIMNVAVCFW